MNIKALEPVIAYLSLGSNLGDRLAYLCNGLTDLVRGGDINIEAISSVYETDPEGITDQPAFLNAVVCVSTSLRPESLLERCQQVENLFGRVRTVRWGPRTLDIDILTYGNIKIETPDLVLPHPRMNERDFVQVPLLEIQTGLVNERKGVRQFAKDWYTG